MMLLLASLSFGFILLFLFSIGYFSSFCTRSEQEMNNDQGKSYTFLLLSRSELQPLSITLFITLS
jgi:hypothetical protein